MRGRENETEIMKDSDREKMKALRGDVLYWYSRSDCEKGDPAATPEGMWNVTMYFIHSVCMHVRRTC